MHKHGFKYLLWVLAISLTWFLLFQNSPHADMRESWCSDNSWSLDISGDECENLVRLYTSTNWSGWTNTGGWFVSTTVCGVWHGINCNTDNHVNNLNLAYNNLSWTIPSLTGLTSLAYLYLNNNGLTDIGDNALDGTNAKFLFLGNNPGLPVRNEMFAGSTPRYLSLDHNWLTSVPDLNVITSLQQLDLSNNQLTISNIPSFTGLSNLNKLDVSSNLLTDIPNIAGLSNLQQLYVSSNQITSLPSFAGFPNLHYLYLDSNQLTTIPDSFTSLNALSVLQIFTNKICTWSLSMDVMAFLNSTLGGSWPSAQDSSACSAPAGFDCSTVTDIPQSECENLVSIYDSTNWSGWTNTGGWLSSPTVCSGGWSGIVCNNHVSIINLSNNNLSWTLPSLTWLSDLMNISLSNNYLTSITNDSFSGLTHLEYIYLDYNQLTNLPSLNWLSSLYSFYANNNFFTDIPDFTGLTGLTFINLDQNDITSIATGAFAGLYSLQTIHLAMNRIAGIGDNAFIGLSSGYYIDVKYNQIGNITQDTLSGLYTTRAWPDWHLFVGDNSLCIDSLSTPMINFLNESNYSFMNFGYNWSLHQDTSACPVPLVVTGFNDTWCDFNSWSLDVPVTECKALARFYNATNGDNWNLYLGGGYSPIYGTAGTGKQWWTTTGICNRYDVYCAKTTIPDVCMQFDVSCIGGHVTKLSIHSSNLSWTVPSLSGLNYLDRLDLENNHISSFASVSDLPSLTYLTLNYNKICIYSLNTDTFNFINTNFWIYWQSLQTPDNCTPPVFSCDTVDISPAECEALVRLYTGTDGDHWTTTGRWLNGWTICNDANNGWNGISCSAGHVTSINLSTNNLSWELPSLSGLAYLTTLNLSSNNITNISSNDFNWLSVLQNLSLQNNQLTTLWADSFNWLSSLLNLHLENNLLTDISTGAFNGLSVLQNLYLQNNQLATLPESLITELAGLPGTYYVGMDWLAYSLSLQNNKICTNTLSSDLISFLDSKASYNDGYSFYYNRENVQDTTACYTCGNGIVETGEQCDDGNNTSGDWCSATCTLEHIPVAQNVSISGTIVNGQTLTGNYTYFNDFWIPVGIQGLASGAVSRGPASYTSLAFDSSWTPYIAYKDDFCSNWLDPPNCIDNVSNITVMKWNWSSWTTIGSGQFSVDGVNSNISLAINPTTNKPYVAYTNWYGSSVMKFNGSNRAFVGTSAFSSGSVYYPSLVIDSDGTPYLAYRDDWHSYKATVKKFNGTDREFVGVPGLSDNYAGSPSLAIDANHILYIAYADGAVGYAITVQKFNGSSWEFVGTQGFSNTQAFDSSITIGNNNTPYVVYQNYQGNTNQQTTTIQKFDGASWVAVGSPIADGINDAVSLAINSSWVAYVAYVDATTSNKATVQKFNGTDREFLGGTPASTSWTLYTSLTINPISDLPYIAYTDSTNNNKATVMKFWTDPQATSTFKRYLNNSEIPGETSRTYTVTPTDNTTLIFEVTPVSQSWKVGAPAQSSGFSIDNCPLVINPDQADVNTNGIGDGCDCYTDNICTTGNDMNNNTICGWSGAYTFVRKWGLLGPDNGQLNWPGDIKADVQWDTYVADSSNNRIQKFIPPVPAGDAACVPGPAVCGNGIIETGEQCDNGANNRLWLYCDANCLTYTVDIPSNRSDQNTIIDEFTRKRYINGTGTLENIQNGTYVGSRRIRSEFSDGEILIPFIMQSTGADKIEMQAPAGIVVKKQDNSPFLGILDTPIEQSTSLATQAGIPNVLAVVDFGNNQNESIHFTDISDHPVNVQLRIPVPGAAIGDFVSVYYSHDDGSTWTASTPTNVININEHPYVSIDTNHLTLFAIGISTGTFVINNDAPSTTSDSVTLNINATWIQNMSFSNTGASGSRSDWEGYDPTKAWTLSTGFGMKTVRAQFDTDGITGTVEAYTNDSINYTGASGIGYCEYGKTLDFGTIIYASSGRSITWSFITMSGNNAWFCNDIQGAAPRTLSIQSSDLLNITTNIPAHTIPSSNIFIKNPAATVSSWICIANSWSSLDARTSIGTDTVVLGKSASTGNICKIETSQVELRIDISAYQALGQYSGTLIITLPSL